MYKFFTKKFKKWLEIKPKIDKKKKNPKYLKKGDVFWYHCGENIGMEISGKGDEFFRPCIIYKILSQSTVVVIPLSTKIKEGSWYIPINSLKRNSIACLHQITSIDTKRLDRKVGELTDTEFENIYIGFLFLYTKIDPLEKTKGISN